MGLDFWWLDGYQGTINGTHPQLVANKLYYENAETAEKRGMLLARYAGLGSHRYGAFFTADTRTGWGVLQLLCEFNIRAGHAGMAYVSHDVGGFAHPRCAAHRPAALPALAAVLPCSTRYCAFTPPPARAAATRGITAR